MTSAPGRAHLEYLGTLNTSLLTPINRRIFATKARTE
jgi:hypothetical protein